MRSSIVAPPGSRRPLVCRLLRCTAAVLAVSVLGVAILSPLVAPGVQPADGGEFQLVTRELGIAHPPGYPLYTLGGHLFGRLVLATAAARWLGVAGHSPSLSSAEEQAATIQSQATATFEPWAWSINLFSAWLAVLTLAVVFQLTRTVAGSLGGVVAALALLAAPTFLAQATVASIRIPVALFTAILFAVGNAALRGAADHSSYRDRSPDSTAERRLPFAFCAGRRPMELESGKPARPGMANDGSVIGLALVTSLALGHHPSLAFPTAVLCVLLARARGDVLRRPRTLILALAAFLVGWAPVLYLPWRDRSGAILAPGNLDTLRGLAAHVSGYGFRGDVLASDLAGAIAERLLVIAQILRLEFGFFGLLLAAVGGSWLLVGASRRDQSASQPAAPSRANRWLGLLLAGSAVLVALAAATYRAPQTVEYLMPTYIALAIAIGSAIEPLTASLLALHRRGTRFGRRKRAVASAASRFADRSIAPTAMAPAWRIVVGLGLALGFGCSAARWAPLVQQANHSPETSQALGILQSDAVRPGSTILANWHFATPLWFAARSGIGRPELRIEYVYPQGAEPLGETLLRRATETARPIILSHRSRELLASDVALWPIQPAPFAALYPVPPRPLTGSDQHPAHDTRLPTGEASWPIRFRRPPVFERMLELEAVDALAQPGGGLQLSVWFRGRRTIEEPLTIVAQLRDRLGAVRGQVDHPHSPTRWNHPAGLADRLVLLPYRRPEASAEALEVVIGVYRWTSAGPTRLRLSDAGLSAGTPVKSVAGQDAVFVPLPEWLSRAAQSPSHLQPPPPQAIPFGNAMTLLSWRIQRTDQAFIVDLRWRADRGYASDYTVSVQLRGRDWYAQHDGTPALGAIPTLKWLPGMIIWDRHRVVLPPNIQSTDAVEWPEVWVAVYDAFTLEPLPITDADLVRRGQGQQLQLSEPSGPQ